jgi:hypothetical protein
VSPHTLQLKRIKRIPGSHKVLWPAPHTHTHTRARAHTHAYTLKYTQASNARESTHLVGMAKRGVQGCLACTISNVQPRCVRVQQANQFIRCWRVRERCDLHKHRLDTAGHAGAQADPKQHVVASRITHVRVCAAVEDRTQ